MNEKINIKITFPFPGFDLKRQLGSEDRNGNFIFHINPADNDGIVYDYWVVFEALGSPVERTLLKRKNATIFFTGEPSTVKKYSSIFLNQFDLVISSHENLKHASVYNYQQSLPWMVRKNYDELKEIDDIPKTKLISIITSNKTITDGHKKRLDFALKLQSLYSGQIDLFGRGIRDFDDKWDTLAPYKFHICLENSSLKNYFTEKITDSFLAMAFPVYHGCTNIEDYFDPRSFKKINIDDVDGSRRVIDQFLEDSSFYAQHAGYLKAARTRCLEEYNLFPFIKKLVAEKMRDAVPVNDTYRKTLLQTPKDMLKTQIKRLIGSKK